MSLTEIFSDGLSFFGEETWILQVFIVVFLTAMLNWMQKRIVKKIISGLQLTRTYWDDALFDAARDRYIFNLDHWTDIRC